MRPATLHSGEATAHDARDFPSGILQRMIHGQRRLRRTVNSATRLAVEREQPRLPLTYFTGRIPVPTGWAGRPAAYLAFGETYAEERDRANRMGWPTRTLVGGHLHALQDPAEVGAAILDLGHRASG